MVKNNQDFRIKRTLARISKSFKHQLIENDFDSLSVIDIMKDSKCSRSTFYCHFSSKEDLYYHHVKEIAKDFLTILNKVALENDQDQADLISALKSLKANKPFVIKMITANHYQLFSRSIEKLVEENNLVQNSFAFVDGEEDLPIPTELALRHYIGLVVSTLDWWLSSENDLNEQKIAKILRKMVLGVPYKIY